VGRGQHTPIANQVIRRLIKWTLRLIAVAVVLIVVVALGRNVFFRLMLERRLEAATGFQTTVGRAQVDWLRPVIRFQHVRLFNPPELGGKPFLDILEAKVTYDFTELLAQRFLVRELEMEIGEVRLVRHEVDVSTQALLSRHWARVGPFVGAVLVDPLMFVGVDRLVLSMDRYVYSDHIDVWRTKDVSLGVRELSVEQLRNRGDWLRLWEQLARARGLGPLPLPPPPVRIPSPTNSVPL